MLSGGAQTLINIALFSAVFSPVENCCVLFLAFRKKYYSFLSEDFEEH